MILLCILVPIIEESIFRCALPSLFGHYTNFKLWNAILFSLMHLSNVHYGLSWKAAICIQLPIAFGFGLYFDSLDNLTLSIIIHVFYDLVTVVTMVIISRIFLHLYPIKLPTIIKTSRCRYVRNRTLSCDSSMLPGKTYIGIKETEIRPNILESLRKFDKICADTVIESYKNDRGTLI